ncbi:MAG: ParB N-terminal domain-containing protein [Desulfobacteraceae bacterium]|nr:ParB N-terminal domain-containing protein [Desulfobacteraceae bacterium]
MSWVTRLKHVWQIITEPDEAKSFSDGQNQERAFESVQRGVAQVALSRIVGSVGRYHDFDSHFRPKNHTVSERYKTIKKAIQEDRKLPPVKLYQIKDEYYVLDGNHRIAVAKELGHEQIEASIIEFIPSKNTLENIIYRQRAQFSQTTGLPYAITLTEIGQYDYLQRQIRSHWDYLKESEKASITYEQSAMDWYKNIYLPLIAIIRKADLLKYFPQRTLDDLYAYISYHQWEQGRKRKYGIGVDRLIPNDMEDFREKMFSKCGENYPEMHREITAFVLMTIRAKNEMRIIEKLSALKEVQEVHSIHGDMDLLVKLTLKRDLVSSDAEIISIFVQEQLRQLQGVLSTQTLIPGFSVIK